MEQTDLHGHQPMTLCRFRHLSPRAQLVLTLAEGTYLAYRWDNERSRVSLYHLASQDGGYFAEVGLNELADRFIVLRSFNNKILLEDYIHYIQLPTLNL